MEIKKQIFSPDLNLTPEMFTVSRDQKEKLNGHKSFVLWFSGLSASGKSTIARHLEEKLHRDGLRTIILDGDNTRIGINKDLDFSPQGREENIRRVAEISALLNAAGVVVIASFISPMEKDRLNACSIIGRDSFIEVFIDAPVEICMQRDPKGLYRKAIDGVIANFTGVSSNYEVPTHPDIHLKTNELSVSEAVHTIYSWLVDNKYVNLDDIKQTSTEITLGQ